MKTIIKDLFFDRELIETIKTTKVSKEQLYFHLMSGKITLREYLAASK